MPDDFLGGAQDLTDFDAAYHLGAKVLEMIDRLVPINAITPGAQAAYSFEVDGRTFKLVMSVKAG
jgi:hypothetical protein